MTFFTLSSASFFIALQISGWPFPQPVTWVDKAFESKRARTDNFPSPSLLGVILIFSTYLFGWHAVSTVAG